MPSFENNVITSLGWDCCTLCTKRVWFVRLCLSFQLCVCDCWQPRKSLRVTFRTEHLHKGIKQKTTLSSKVRGCSFTVIFRTEHLHKGIKQKTTLSSKVRGCSFTVIFRTEHLHKGIKQKRTVSSKVRGCSFTVVFRTEQSRLCVCPVVWNPTYQVHF